MVRADLIVPTPTPSTGPAEPTNVLTRRLQDSPSEEVLGSRDQVILKAQLFVAPGATISHAATSAQTLPSDDNVHDGDAAPISRNLRDILSHAALSDELYQEALRSVRDG